MGGNPSTPKPTTDTLFFTTAPPATASTPFLTNCPTKNSKGLLHLILAFFAGVLLTLLLMGLVFLIIKSYRKRHSRSPVLDPCSDPPNKLSAIPEEALTYASMTFQISEEKSNRLTANCSADLDSTVYTQIKVAN
ncbi:transmembrane protein C1orf162 homolog [Choloepus didactylus]|uniref:transmembrane protein C1orf162 homolog n=1 Tax=Choloepus didactylus TaxID=27675 RepID=UPI00189C852F|nr:transmembrane protein C1orf162 homolog [Choloepus didactylus]XP_037682311.1 transmembrane protein C1orf162 homolog [Choloepus didactylus]XP_037682312.1 transmembrane protein C1orf162 homolog [Choloepus didactylus]XP_037682313.1 transmembrane protein C1orf162 homolog [Choloepus didactylus]XP_037682314.1 transmembrane protein C1orf162 homolog [Choloepus didactylus]